MESENLLAAVFPDQLACLENIAGDRVVPDHPLVRQTVEDCLTEAMDVEGLITLLERIESGAVQCVARDLPEPSPLAHEIIRARPYAFLDNAPLEERRTQAVYTRRASQPTHADDLGALDSSAIARVCAEAWPRATNPDELHEALLLMGVMTDNDVRCGMNDARSTVQAWLDQLVAEKRVGHLTSSPRFWVAAERLPMVKAVYSDSEVSPALVAPASALKETWDRQRAARELVRGRLEVIGPVTADALAEFFDLPRVEIDAALVALETEGFVLRGRFHPDPAPVPATSLKEIEWCDRRLLARIHRLTINRLRAEIQPVSLADFQRFLLAWQRADAGHCVEGSAGLEAVLELLDGYQLPAAAWEPEVLALRIKGYAPEWLDQLCFSGRIGWGRLTPPPRHNGRPFAPVRSSPVSIFVRDNLPYWLVLSAVAESSPGDCDLVTYSADTVRVLETFKRRGALFFAELVKQTGLLPSRVEQALAELTAHGLVSADSFEGLRALLVPGEKRVSFVDPERRRRHRPVTSVEFAGRWSLLREPSNTGAGLRSNPARNLSLVDGPQAVPVEGAQETPRHEDAVEAFGRGLLRRYGVVFRRMLERESLTVSWFELVRVYRRLEARGEIRGGHFVSGVSGEQFALPEAIGSLRSIRKEPGRGELIAICGADPLNATGILTPGPRVAGITANRILLRDGLPIAALEAGRIIALKREAQEPDNVIEHALRVGSMPAALRPYY
jgi:ATP-dependent Lhr-like helicase